MSVEALDPNSKLVAIRRAFFESLSATEAEEVERKKERKKERNY